MRKKLGLATTGLALALTFGLPFQVMGAGAAMNDMANPSPVTTPGVGLKNMVSPLPGLTSPEANVASPSPGLTSPRTNITKPLASPGEAIRESVVDIKEGVTGTNKANRGKHTGGDYNMNTYRTNAATGTDNRMNWGWLGLIGLFGLAGLRSKGKEESRDRV